jgi:hypothetical protein
MPKSFTLWHYTDAAGLLGIIRSSQLRFGDVRFLNDQTEQVYAERLLKDVVATASLPDKHGVLASAVEAVDSASHPVRLYIASFSETKESISQWQRYGADGAGYCIGFEAPILDSMFASDISRKKMRYKQTVQKQLLKKKLQGASEEQEDWAAVDPTYLSFQATIRSMRLAGELDDVMLQIKNPFFADEREWRYVLMVDENAKLPWKAIEEFVQRGAYVKPFVGLPAKGTVGAARLPVTTVVCGPKLSPHVALPAITRFLHARGYGSVTVEQSALAEIWR